MNRNRRLYLTKLYAQLIFWVLKFIGLLLVCWFEIQHLIDLLSHYF